MDSEKKLRHLCECANLPKSLCNHLLGHNHSLAHRLVAGGVVMFAGGSIAYFGPMLYDGTFYHITVDVLGYSIHGIGLVPFVEAMLASIPE